MSLSPAPSRGHFIQHGLPSAGREFLDDGADGFVDDKRGEGAGVEVGVAGSRQIVHRHSAQAVRHV